MRHQMHIWRDSFFVRINTLETTCRLSLTFKTESSLKTLPLSASTRC